MEDSAESVTGMYEVLSAEASGWGLQKGSFMGFHSHNLIMAPRLSAPTALSGGPM